MTYFQPPLQADCLKTASMQDRLIHWCHELFSNAENCGNAAITSSDPDNGLLPLSYGTNFISDTLLNAAGELFALNLEATFRGNGEGTERSADHHLRGKRLRTRQPPCYQYAWLMHVRLTNMLRLHAVKIVIDLDKCCCVCVCVRHTLALMRDSCRRDRRAAWDVCEWAVCGSTWPQTEGTHKRGANGNSCSSAGLL